MPKSMPAPAELHHPRDEVKFFLFLIAVSLSALEYLFPRIPLFPWLKPGLANVVTIVWLVRYGFRDALLFSLLRIWITAFYFGFSFVSVGLALSGALLSCTAMAIVWKLAGQRGLVGSVGISIIGALFHNAGQLCAAYLLLAGNALLFAQYPLMIAAALVFGTFVGVLAPPLLRYVEHTPMTVREHFPTIIPQWPSHIRAGIGIMLLLFCTTVACVNNVLFLAGGAFVTTLIAMIAERKVLKVLLFPLHRFWMMFLVVAIFPLFSSYGKIIWGIPFLTDEGLNAAIVQCIRLFIWLECVFLFRHTGFNDLLYRILTLLFPRHSQTLHAGLLAAEHFPAVASAVQGDWKRLLMLLLKKPGAALEELRVRIDLVAGKI